MMTSAVLFAGIVRFAVPATGDAQVLPDSLPASAVKDAPCAIVAACGEYEGGSFVLQADADYGKLAFRVGDLKNEKGEVFPASELDLTTVKVWYQNSNAWISYFQDPRLVLCPELLLHDEDLVRVDTKKRANYARLTEKDGSVSWYWLTAPRGIHKREVDLAADRCDDAFPGMKENFCDTPTFAGATLEKGRYKQFMLTAHVAKGTKPGLYTGAITLVAKDGRTVGEVPVRLRVLDFELPAPKTYFDVTKDFRSLFCEYVSISWIRQMNGNDLPLAKRQLAAILRDFARHNETTPSFREKVEFRKEAIEAGMDFRGACMGGMKLVDNADVRYAARVAANRFDRLFGFHKGMLMTWGDEYGLGILRGIRDMVGLYHDEGFTFAVNSQYGYDAGANLADLWWPPWAPDQRTAGRVRKYNELGGDGSFGWYASQHVGAENPAFTRRQYGLGPYLAGFGCNYNYAHHLEGWNDVNSTLYRPMMFVYGAGNGCIDTLAWEGFREAIDDIRYATLLKSTALDLVKNGSTEARYAAKLALKLLADAKGDDFDLTTFRYEMINHILKMNALKK